MNETIIIDYCNDTESVFVRTSQINYHDKETWNWDIKTNNELTKKALEGISGIYNICQDDNKLGKQATIEESIWLTLFDFEDIIRESEFDELTFISVSGKNKNFTLTIHPRDTTQLRANGDDEPYDELANDTVLCCRDKNGEERIILNMDNPENSPEPKRQNKH